MNRRGYDLSFRLKDGSGTMIFSLVLRQARLTGTVTYRQRSALPRDAIVEVWLQDVSKADAPAVLLGHQSIAANGRQVPFAFAIAYDPSRITPNTIVVVRASISSGGKLLFTTTTSQRVITGGYPSDTVDVVVQPVR